MLFMKPKDFIRLVDTYWDMYDELNRYKHENWDDDNLNDQLILKQSMSDLRITIFKLLDIAIDHKEANE